MMGSVVIWAPLIMILVGWMFPSSLVWTLSQVPEVVVPVRWMVDGWWPAAPVRGEAVKEPLFDRLSLAGARGQVADGGVRPGFGGTGPVTVGAGQQGPGRRVGAVAGLVEPAADGPHGERGRVVLRAHRHPPLMPLMGRGGVDAVGFGLARGRVGDVVHTDPHRVPGVPPGHRTIGEQADEFPFLHFYADHRVPGGQVIGAWVGMFRAVVVDGDEL